MDTKNILKDTDEIIIKEINNINRIKNIIDNATTNLKKQYFLKKLKKVQKNIISLTTARSYLDGTLKISEKNK